MGRIWEGFQFSYVSFWNVGLIFIELSNLKQLLLVKSFYVK